MEYIVDFQAFKKPVNDFVIKEMVLLNTSGDIPEVYNFKPPFTWDELPARYKVENKWLETHYIYKTWSEGFIEYKELENVLKKLSKAKKVYVKGDQKYQWFKKYLNNVHNLEGNNILALNELRKLNFLKCKKHTYEKNDISCAECNVIAIYLWCIFYLRMWK